MPSDAAVRDSDGAPKDQSVERLRALLDEALGIVDALKLSPEIGARLDEVIRAVEQRGGSDQA